MNKIFMVILFLLAGCEHGYNTNYNVYISKSCTEQEQEMIRDAVVEFNGYADVWWIDIEGVEDIGYDKDDGIHAIVCLDGYGPSGKREVDGKMFKTRTIGRTSYGDIRIWMGGLDDRKMRIVFRHELIHFVGAKSSEHFDDTESVFSAFIKDDTSTRYTERDISLIERVTVEENF